MNEPMSMDELNRRVSLYVRKIHLMHMRNQISAEDLNYIRLASYPIARRQWQLPVELAHLEAIYAATDPNDIS